MCKGCPKGEPGVEGIIGIPYKYYIPEIEEFHVGFEFETGENDIWFNRKGIPLDKEGRVKNENTRVKYLDKEDIESLGFVPNAKDTYGMATKDIHSNEDNITHIIHRGLWWVLITQGNIETTFSDWNTRFSGIIKNKSELKVLLKQLNILT